MLTNLYKERFLIWLLLVFSNTFSRCRFVMFHIFFSLAALRRRRRLENCCFNRSWSRFEVRLLKSSFPDRSLDRKKADSCLLFFVNWEGNFKALSEVPDCLSFGFKVEVDTFYLSDRKFDREQITRVIKYDWKR